MIAAWLTRQGTPATRGAGNVASGRALADWVDLNNGYDNFTYRIPDLIPVHGTVLLNADWRAGAWLTDNVAAVEVQRVLAANWSVLVDPTTTSARLFQLGGWSVPGDFVRPHAPTGRGAVIAPRTRCADLAS